MKSNPIIEYEEVIDEAKVVLKETGKVVAAIPQ